jgi:hypothetical protein
MQLMCLLISCAVAEVYDVTTVYKFAAPYANITDEGMYK